MRAGRSVGPRIYSPAPASSPARTSAASSTRRTCSRYSAYYDTKTIKMYGAGNREQRQWIIQAARELELMPTTEGSLDLRRNLTMAQDGYSGHRAQPAGHAALRRCSRNWSASTMATTPPCS